MSSSEARRRLEAERADLRTSLGHLQNSFDDIVAAARDSNGDDEHDIEGDTVAYSRSQVDALAQGHRRRLAEVDLALARLDEGDYGICRGCGGPIGEGRLEARPATPWCIDCALLHGA